MLIKTSFNDKIYQNLLITYRIKTIQVLLKHRQINHIIKNKTQMAMDNEKEVSDLSHDYYGA